MQASTPHFHIYSILESQCNVMCSAVNPYFLSMEHRMHDNVELPSTLNVGMFDTVEGWVKRILKTEKTYTDKELDSVILEVEHLYKKEHYDKTVELLNELILHLKDPKKTKEVIEERWQSRLRLHKQMQRCYAKLVAADVALEKAGLAVPTPQP